MCIQIHITLPGKIKTEKIADILEKYKITLKKREIKIPASNQNDVCYFVKHQFSKGWCDCDTELRILRRKQTKEIDMWYNLLQDLLKNDNVLRVGLILLWVDEHEKVKQKHRINIKDLKKEMLDLDVNTLYEFFKEY